MSRNILESARIGAPAPRRQETARIGACNGCNNMPQACVCSRGPYVLPGDWTPQPGGLPPPSSGLPPIPVPMMLPRNIDPGAFARGLYGAAQVCVPWRDAMNDCKFMSQLASAVTAVAAAASVNVTLQPDSGWFDGYYIIMAAWDAAGVDVTNNLVTMGPPSLPGCPPPPCDDTPTPIGLWTIRDGCCCGRPYRTLAPATSLGVGGPLTIPVTNGTAATVNVQAIILGFCHPNRICF